MKVAIAVIRPFHTPMMANLLSPHVSSVDIYTSAPRKYFRNLNDSVRTHLVPAPVQLVDTLVKWTLPRWLLCRDVEMWDRVVSRLLPPSDVVVGFGGQGGLSTGKAARRMGARFVLDRACPYMGFQQRMMTEESVKVGTTFQGEPAWFSDRQVEEYELADVILTPSRYTARSFPQRLQEKIAVAPLMGRMKAGSAPQLRRHDTFTVGVVGGNPVRKGYLYLLEAWKKLALPNAKLLIRSGADFNQYPVLARLLAELPSVQVIDFVPDMADFYAQCDAFALPSMDDGFGMALLEGMMSGLPSIATRNCGASELLTDGEDGLVVDAGDVDQLAAAILRLYEDEHLRCRIAVAGRVTAGRVKDESLYEQALLKAFQAVPVGYPVTA